MVIHSAMWFTLPCKALCYGNALHHGNILHHGDPLCHGNALHHGNIIHNGDTLCHGNALHHGDTLCHGDVLHHGNILHHGDALHHVMHSIIVIYFTMGMHSTMVMLSIMVIYFTTDRKAWQQNDAHKWAGQETGSEFRPKPDSSYNLKGLAS